MSRPKVNTASIKISLSPGLLEKLRFCAEFNGLTVSEYCRHIIHNRVMYNYYDYLRQANKNAKIEAQFKDDDAE